MYIYIYVFIYIYIYLHTRKIDCRCIAWIGSWSLQGLNNCPPAVCRAQLLDQFCWRLHVLHRLCVSDPGCVRPQGVTPLLDNSLLPTIHSDPRKLFPHHLSTMRSTNGRWEWNGCHKLHLQECQDTGVLPGQGRTTSKLHIHCWSYITPPGSVVVPKRSLRFQHWWLQSKLLYV